MKGVNGGPEDADVTHWEGGGSQTGLNLEMTSHRQDAPSPLMFFHTARKV